MCSALLQGRATMQSLNDSPDGMAWANRAVAGDVDDSTRKFFFSFGVSDHHEPSEPKFYGHSARLPEVGLDSARQTLDLRNSRALPRPFPTYITLTLHSQYPPTDSGKGHPPELARWEVSGVRVFLFLKTRRVGEPSEEAGSAREKVEIVSLGSFLGKSWQVNSRVLGSW